MHRNTYKFTIVELLIVISIIVILMSMLLPVLNKVRGRAHAILCTSHLKQTGTVMAFYIGDHDEYYPVRSCYDAAYPYMDGRLHFFNFFRYRYYNRPVGETPKSNDMLYCPAEIKHNQGSVGADLGFNMNVMQGDDASARMPQVAADTVLLGDQGTGAVSPTSTLLNGSTAPNYLAFRHEKLANLLIADGSVRAIRRDKLKEEWFTIKRD